MAKTTYLITGANRGIGYGFVEKLVQRDDVEILATARSVASATKLNELAKSTGKIKVLPLEVDSDESVVAFGKLLAEIPGLSIDVLILNAAIAQVGGTVEQVEREVWIKHWMVNCLGTVEVYKAVFPFLSDKSKLVFISSIVGSISTFHIVPFPVSAYGASKAYLNFVMREISIERAGKSIVISLNPGSVSTDMGKPGQDLMAELFDGTIPGEVEFLNTDQSVTAQLKVIDGLTESDNGKFYSYNGDEVPW